MPVTRPILAISACLLGEQVRYDGAHARDNWLAAVLAGYVDYRPICPEVGIGLGIPRPPIHLVGQSGQERAVGVRNPELDVTERLEDFALRTAAGLGDISGYVFKSKSPSCGMERVRLYNPQGQAEKKGVGIHARTIMRAMPDLPVEEDGRLNDPVLRENFVNRIFVYRRWQDLRASGLSRAALIAFHADHKYLLMAHSQAAYQRLGRLLADLKGVDLACLADRYQAEMMAALARRVTRKRHVNVLQHVFGYLKKRIDAGDKAELGASIEAYRRGEVPLIVPTWLLRDYFRRYPDAYIERQYYLDPYPPALGLRNLI